MIGFVRLDPALAADEWDELAAEVGFVPAALPASSCGTV